MRWFFKKAKFQENTIYSEKYLRDHINDFDINNWVFISRCQNLSEDFMREYSDKLDWEFVSKFQKFGIDFVYDFKNKIKFDVLDSNKNIPDEMVDLYKQIGKGYNPKIKYSEKYADEYSYKLEEGEWMHISGNIKLSENFIYKYGKMLDWDYASSYQNLNEEIIRKFNDIVNWYLISFFQKLSEDFIIEFKDKVDWDCIARNQQLSEKFIIENREKLNIKYLMINKKIDNHTKQKIKEGLL